MSSGERYRWLEVGDNLTLTFDLESYFRIFSIQAITFEWLDLATSFSVWRYIFRISRSHSSFKFMGLKVSVTATKTTGRKLQEVDWNMCYHNARSDLEFLTFQTDICT